MREFSKWVGQEIEKVCDRNDRPRDGKPQKPPWERQTPVCLFVDIFEEIKEVVEAFEDREQCPSTENLKKLQWELADLAAVAMMLSARLDPIMSGLRRGRVRGRDI